MRVIYSFNKTGHEANFWQRELHDSSTPDCTFIPFNHGIVVEPSRYARAQLLDNLYHSRDSHLMRLYAMLESLIGDTRADALIADNYAPYHPEFLLRLNVYKVLRTSDGPLAAYDRDFAYVHAYDHVFYHSPAYSPDLGMAEKLAYCGARRADLWPLALFDAMHDTAKNESTVMSHPRDIDIVFVGALFPNKMPLLAKVKRAFRRNFRLYGLATLKKNVYFNLSYGFPGWVRPIAADGYVSLYQRARIGINVHNRGKYTVGGYRLFELPGNGVMQISDGGEYLEQFFESGREVVAYESADELIDKIRYYLMQDAEREQIALSGYRRVHKDHGIRRRMSQAAGLIAGGLANRRTKSAPPKTTENR